MNKKMLIFSILLPLAILTLFFVSIVTHFFLTTNKEIAYPEFPSYAYDVGDTNAIYYGVVWYSNSNVPETNKKLYEEYRLYKYDIDAKTSSFVTVLRKNFPKFSSFNPFQYQFFSSVSQGKLVFANGNYSGYDFFKFSLVDKSTKRIFEKLSNISNNFESVERVWPLTTGNYIVLLDIDPNHKRLLAVVDESGNLQESLLDMENSKNFNLVSSQGPEGIYFYNLSFLYGVNPSAGFTTSYNFLFKITNDGTVIKDVPDASSMAETATGRSSLLSPNKKYLLDNRRNILNLSEAIGNNYYRAAGSIPVDSTSIMAIPDQPAYPSPFNIFISYLLAQL